MMSASESNVNLISLLSPVPVQLGTWQQIGIDLIGPLPETPSGNKYIMLCVTLYFDFVLLYFDFVLLYFDFVLLYFDFVLLYFDFVLLYFDSVLSNYGSHGFN